MEQTTEQSIKKSLYNKMKKQVVADLTSGRDDNDLPQFTPGQNEQVITHYNQRITQAVDDMYAAFEEDNKLNDLINPEADWIREFLYEKLPCDYFLSTFNVIISQ